ncbi:MAG: UTP--glucose-1-phosphate uridylyltransferase [Proteobacteria bacterium]|nr:UTP--glucose-1-phosphate uridylyltransferase [Pseudomonadota bacterium]MBU1596520.1 UTP--glucose-1-phosphate uridylyltransferase [Pseudomonadota bacterium]
MKISCLTAQDSAVHNMFRPFALKMEERRIPSIVINVFKCYYTQIIQGAQGKTSDAEISPLAEGEVPTYASLEPYIEAGRSALKHTVVIKLNGGLGTSMGLERAKSLIPVKDGHTFLDIIVRQAKVLRKKYKSALPLTFMNSFKTHRDTMLKVEGLDNGDTGIPLAFVQHMYPKIQESDLAPADWPQNPELEWNPPGHGDVFTAMVTSGLLSKLLRRNYRYAFISNSDNLGAVMDSRLLGYMAKEQLPFLMEVAQRAPLDRKGGHLARLKNTARFMLRELAQCPDNELESFADIEKYRYFNTNSLWVDLEVLEKVFVDNLMMPLDLILNPKTLDPRDPDSPPVLQVETAMGSAISAFENARVVLVPRTRFAPVKTTQDLLLVMSDCFLRTKLETIEQSPQCATPLPAVVLDQKYYKKIDMFQERFPKGAPSLLGCERLEVHGDVRFGRNVKCIGNVRVINRARKQGRIPDNTRLEGEVILE